MGIALPILLLAMQAAPTGADGDIRCLVVSTILATESDPNLKAAGMSASLYFYGRVNGRFDAAALNDAMERETRALTPERFQSETDRCGAEMRDAGKRLQATGQELKRRLDTEIPR